MNFWQEYGKEMFIKKKNTVTWHMIIAIHKKLPYFSEYDKEGL